MLIQSPTGRSSANTRAPSWWLPMAIIGAVLVAIIAIIIGGGNEQAWEATSLAGHPLALLINPHNSQSLYVATEQGKILQTDDAGKSWTDLSKGIPPNTVISALAASSDGSALFAGGNNGVYRSRNAGATWTAITGNLPHEEVFDVLLPLSTSGDIVLAGTAQSGIYQTTNGGMTWQSVAQGLPSNADMYALMATPDDSMILAGTIGNGVYISHDHGATWQPSNNGIPDQYDVFALVQPDPVQHPQTIVAGTNGGIYLSADGGKSWHDANTGLPATRVISLTVDTKQAATIVAGTDNGVYATTNSGANWSVVQQQFSTDNHVGAVALLHMQGQPAIIFAAADRLYRYPGQASLIGFGLVRIVGFGILLGLMIFVMYRQNQFTRQQSARYEAQAARLRSQRMANDTRFSAKKTRPIPSHIRRGLPLAQSDAQPQDVQQEEDSQ